MHLCHAGGYRLVGVLRWAVDTPCPIHYFVSAGEASFQLNKKDQKIIYIRKEQRYLSQ
jgi:hypothetical protein